MKIINGLHLLLFSTVYLCAGDVEKKFTDARRATAHIHPQNIDNCIKQDAIEYMACVHALKKNVKDFSKIPEELYLLNQKRMRRYAEECLAKLSVKINPYHFFDACFSAKTAQFDKALLDAFDLELNKKASSV